MGSRTAYVGTPAVGVNVMAGPPWAAAAAGQSSSPETRRQARRIMARIVNCQERIHMTRSPRLVSALVFGATLWLSSPAVAQSHPFDSAQGAPSAVEGQQQVDDLRR